jgi:hypothetical protein
MLLRYLVITQDVIGEVLFPRPNVQPTETKHAEDNPHDFRRLLIAGSTVQMATASEHHERKAHRAPISTSWQFRNAYGSIEGPFERFIEVVG